MLKTNQKKFGSVKTLEKIGISFERLRYWEKMGIVKPKYLKHGTRKFRKYSADDISRAIFISKLVDKGGYSLQGARKKLTKENYPQII
jgi:DNA-binding transcriptional MerR regulator